MEAEVLGIDAAIEYGPVVLVGFQFVGLVYRSVDPRERILEDDRDGFHAARDDLDVVHLVAGLALFFRAVDRGVDNQTVGRFHVRHFERYLGPCLRSRRYGNFVCLLYTSDAADD